MREAIFADEAKLAPTRIIVPREAVVGPYVDAILHAIDVVRFIVVAVPVGVRHRQPRHSVMIVDKQVPRRNHLPTKRTGVHAISGRPEIDAPFISEARTKRRVCKHAKINNSRERHQHHPH